MSGRKAVQQRILWGFGIAGAVATAIALGWAYGRTHRLSSHENLKNGGSVQSFRVVGSSMVPTLYGPTLQLDCQNCRHQIQLDAHSLSRERGDLICSLCGQRHDMNDQSFLQSLTKLAGDVVEVTSISAQEYRLGDLIAIDHAGKTQVKRIAALAGDIVDARDSRLLVNDQRLEDLLESRATMIVDDDAYRTESRWLMHGDASGWTRDDQRWWHAETDEWLVYHHHNVHDHNQASGVMDDYQYNAGVARRLRSVDRLALSGTLTSDKPITMQVAFWSAEGNRLANRTIPGNREFRISVFDATERNDLPVGEETPVAIRMVGEHATVGKLVVNRNVEYRFNREHRLDGYPLAVVRGQVFVVGDNVPYSVDSRTWGTIPMERILGRVRIVESIGRPKP